ncbi:MAG: MFS transporter [Elusimicrobiota bacterium]
MKDRIYFFFIATYFAQGMVGIAYEPIAYLLKDDLGLSAAESGVFVAWMTLPFLFRPLMGVVSDALPLGGRRRVPYLLIFSAATTAGWAGLAAMRAYAYWPVLALLALVNTGIAFADVLCDGVMVEHGKRLAKTGAYQAAQIGTLYFTLFATGVGGGWLAQHASYRMIFALTAVFPLAIFATTFVVPETPAAAAGRQARLLWRGMRGLLSTRAFWAACLILLLFSFNPFQGTAFFYYQTDALGFSKLLIGTLTSVEGLAGVAGAALFWRYYDKRVNIGTRSVLLDTATLVRWSVLLSAPLTLLYWAYRGPASALALTSFFGVVGVAMRLSLMDLVARACPEHGEATAFALFMSVFNLAAWSSNTAGARAYETLAAGSAGAHGTMAILIAVGALAKIACWPLLRSVRVSGPQGQPA